jgi:hypothetical protein
MGEESNVRRDAELVVAVRELTAVNEQVARSLANLEALYAEELRKQDEERKRQGEERAEFKERQKKWDEEHEEFRQRQKKWDEQDKWGGLGTSTLLFQVKILLFFIALAALAVAQCVQVSRH